MGADAAALRRARRLGFTIVEQTELAGLGTSIVILRAPAGLTVRDALQRLRKSDRRTIYDYNHVYGYRPTTSGGSLVIADGAPQRSPLSTRDDLIIGMIDASISGDHEALRDATLERRDFSEGQLGSDHGLAVGSLLVAETGGLLPNAKLYAASVFFKSQSGDTVGATVALVRALDWMVAKRVAVINMSLAGPDNAVLKTAVARAVEAGHVIVAAVGNDGPAAKPLYPASYDGVVGVTAIDASERVYRRAGRGEQVDFAAPGVDIHAAARDGYARHTGTSFAAPHLAALIATELQAPDAVVREALLQRVLESAKDLGKPGRDTVYGHGLPAMGPR